MVKLSRQDTAVCAERGPQSRLVWVAQTKTWSILEVPRAPGSVGEKQVEGNQAKT